MRRLFGLPKKMRSILCALCLAALPFTAVLAQTPTPDQPDEPDEPQPAIAVSGRVVMQDGGPIPQELLPVTVWVMSADGSWLTSILRPAAVAADGSFHLLLAAGEYRLLVPEPRHEGYYVRSVVHGQTSVRESTLRIAPGTASAEIVITLARRDPVV